MARKKKESIECPICLENIKNEITTDCNHIFCDICLVKNLIITNNCPMCRTLCNYNNITNQIGMKRQKTIMNKLKIRSFPQQPISINEELSITMVINQEQHQEHINIYSRFYTPQLPSCVFILFIFVIEVFLISNYFFLIIQKVKEIYSL